MCVCNSSDSVSWCGAVLCVCHIVTCYDAPVEVEHQQATNPRPNGKEPRANRNVNTQTVSAEPLAVRTHPQEDGLGTGSKSGTP